MYGRNHTIVGLLLLAASHFAWAQAGNIPANNPKKSKSLVLYAGGGASYYTSGIQTPAGVRTGTTTINPATTFRIMWHPQYRLRIGLETGSTNFYSYSTANGNEKGKLTLAAIPLLVVWSMPIVKRVNVYAGVGSYFLTTHLHYKGEVKSKSISLGANFALDYQQPVSKNLRLVVEAKWTDAFVTRNTALSLQLQVAWRFLEWGAK